MRLLLREALRRLCVEIGWSYAVFWKAVGCGNLRHLIWEEGHYEPTRASAVSGISPLEATESLLKEWQVFQKTGDDHFGELTSQEQNRVGILVNKMMMPQVHAVGDGIVGRAAFTGNHQWILQNTCNDEGYMLEGFAEMNHQFLAGIQTITVIPVLPHGVVQLGSTQMIMENLGFIQHVRHLFMQLGCVPGALLSESRQKDLVQKNKVPSLGSPISVVQSGNAWAKLASISPFISENCKQQFCNFPAPRAVIQPSCSSGTQFYDNKSLNVQGMPLNSIPITATVGKSLQDYSQLTEHPSILPINGQPEDGPVVGQVVLSNTDVMFQQTSMNQSSSGTRRQHSLDVSGLSSSSLSYLAQQLLSSVGLQEFPNHIPTLDNCKTLQLRPCEQTTSSSLKDSAIVSLFGTNESFNNVNDLKLLGSVPCSTGRKSIGIQNANLSGNVAPHILSCTNLSNNNCALPGEVTPSNPPSMDKHAQTVSTVGLQKIGNELFQALDNPHIDSNECAPCSGLPLDCIQDCSLSSFNHIQASPRSQNAVCEENNNSTAQNGQIAKDNDESRSLPAVGENTSDVSIPHVSGDDLFDALGLDFKSKHCPGGLDAVVVSRNDANAWESGTDVSTCITQLDVDPVFNVMHDEIPSGSRIFSETGPDQLLDAVVSKINSGARQSSNNDVSVKTTLTKISSSSLHITPPKYGWSSSSQQMQGELFGHSPVVKTEAVGLGSVKSACSMDGTGECSQRDRAFTSKISLWDENGQNMKIDGISAAQCKIIDETGKFNRKRPRLGESPRPRPKDRQMIQDRVKELREIVPNGAKCSIDALLELTIKHMLFLQSVAKHADKLKETGEPKIISKEGGFLLKDNFEGGATWAFEVGTQSMVCPILVEDLNPPRQLLVEMLCEERGFFLEIANLIRGLGLTILKGVMEARNDKVWARFAVEANRDVTRMDIFMSLVRLLEPTVGSAIEPQGIDHSNMARSMFCQSSSIPATGLANQSQ